MHGASQAGIRRGFCGQADQISRPPFDLRSIRSRNPGRAKKARADVDPDRQIAGTEAGRDVAEVLSRKPTVQQWPESVASCAWLCQERLIGFF
jgi:hypothetical protein